MTIIRPNAETARKAALVNDLVAKGIDLVDSGFKCAEARDRVIGEAVLCGRREAANYRIEVMRRLNAHVDTEVI